MEDAGLAPSVIDIRYQRRNRNRGCPWRGAAIRARAFEARRGNSACSAEDRGVPSTVCASRPAIWPSLFPHNGLLRRFLPLLLLVLRSPPRRRFLLVLLLSHLRGQTRPGGDRFLRVTQPSPLVR